MKNSKEAPMTDSLFIRIAKGKIADYLLEVGSNADLSKSELMAKIRMTWYSYIARNYKAMFCIHGFKGKDEAKLSNRYFEVTYIAKDDEFVADEYLQFVPTAEKRV
ncbi:hypothetical protein HYQ54_1990 [Lactobacillus crispatus]|uniref:DUF6275 family protein n=1 Tax=Lactobacillus crispatus TaxID=47770 RepID=UPI0018E29E72|nr:DUF6275 family protein [Lactobacillus crispatus]MBI1715437.1 hypothetical protein [Lactobacillus crispatus]